MRLFAQAVVAAAFLVLVPSAFGRVTTGVSESGAPAHTSSIKDTKPPVVHTWHIKNQYYIIAYNVYADIGVSDNASKTYGVRVKVKFKGRALRIWPAAWLGYCTYDGKETMAISRDTVTATKFKRGHYIAYASARDEAGNKSKAKRCDFWVR